MFMVKVEDCSSRLKEIGAPRFHYLIGIGEIKVNESYFDFRGQVYFDSSIPSIGDRQKENPHVNVTDSLHAIWNSIHLISSEVGTKSTLAAKVLNERVYGIIPADKELDIYTKVTNLKEFQRKIFSKYESVISLNGKKLFERSGIGSWEKN